LFVSFFFVIEKLGLNQKDKKAIFSLALNDLEYLWDIVHSRSL